MSDRNRKSRSRSYSRSKSSSKSKSRTRSRSDGSRERDRSRNRRSRSRSRNRDTERAEGKPSNILSVFGLGTHTTERDVKDAFSRHGRVTDVKIIYDGKTGRSRGFGFIYFSKPEDAISAKEEMHGYDLDGHKLRVEFSLTKEPHRPTPGIYMGYSNNRYHNNNNNRRSPPRYSRRSPRYSRHSRSRSRSRSYDHGQSRYNRRSPSPYYR